MLEGLSEQHLQFAQHFHFHFVGHFSATFQKQFALKKLEEKDHVCQVSQYSCEDEIYLLE